MRHSLFGYLYRVTAPSRTRLAWWDLSEIALAGFGFLLYFLVRGAVVDRAGDALDHARMIVDWQAAVGLFIEPRVQEWTLQSDVATRLFNFVYFWFDFPLIIGVGLVMFWRSRSHYTLLRDACLISGGFALLLYWSFPVAPPRFLTEWGMVDTLELYSNLSYQAQSTQPFVNPYAAVPSLHVGWAALLAVSVWLATPNPWARAAGVTVFVLQTISVMTTGNHFLFDGLAGLVVCAPALALALWLRGRGYPAIRDVLRRAMERSAQPTGPSPLP